MIQPFNSRRIARNRIALALAVLLASVLAITALSVGAAASTTTEQIAEEELEIEEGEHIETELAFADNYSINCGKLFRCNIWKSLRDISFVLWVFIKRPSGRALSRSTAHGGLRTICNVG